eukprot:TRINITY_DN11012_c0_g1_i1.p1 TRINITY_DN11012_c0_g1~~TRINITY_DN11012_c0_g1_i1.p1  ORF type:complete len:260 (+),score=30.03 TRINITY_DN11012_c0_g1_i1:137-916(+)
MSLLNITPSLIHFGTSTRRLAVTANFLCVVFRGTRKGDRCARSTSLRTNSFVRVTPLLATTATVSHLLPSPPSACLTSSPSSLSLFQRRCFADDASATSKLSNSKGFTIGGQCHCGNISFELLWGSSSPSASASSSSPPTEIHARACTCSFCLKHGGVWTSSPSGSLSISFKDSAKVSQYEFGTKTAQFHVCSCCGVVPVVTSTIEGKIYAVVNVHTFEGVDSSLLKSAPTSSEGESAQMRLDRRKRNWIGDVRFTSAS